ncbi:MAG: glycosyltransferase family 4 protein [Clostridia bacterium]|nr:glycosyltransferase family 4 protein [Clostridia bacterium]
MKIAIDCRYIGKSGIGRVCKGILDNLDYSQNEYFLVGEKSKLSSYKFAQIIENNSNPFSVKGLFRFGKEINKKCDCLIIPNFIVPLGVKIPVYSIIHDLIFLDLKKMTKNFVDKLIKKFLLVRCVKKSKKISCVSKFTYDRCIKYYGKYKDKFFVNYNGLSPEILDYSYNHKTVEQKNNDLIYVGNVKPHKGLKTLIEAFKLLPSDYSLKIIGEKDNFITGLDVSDIELNNLEFTGKMSDGELFEKIANAKFLIQPSEYEGFGLPPLEALCLGTKPIVSDIEVFKEVYEGFDVTYFKCGDVKSLEDAILSSKSSVEDCRDKIVEKYNYRNCVNNLLDKIKGESL